MKLAVVVLASVLALSSCSLEDPELRLYGDTFPELPEVVALIENQIELNNIPPVEIKVLHLPDAMGYWTGPWEGAPYLIEVNENMSSEERFMTLMHELGHHIHLYDASPLAKAEDEIYRAILETDRYWEWWNSAQDGSTWEEYAIGNHEVMARAFAQWVVEADGPQWAKDHVHRVYWQWAAEDFIPVAEAFDKVLGEE